MPTNPEHTDVYAVRAAEFGVYDRARLALVRRAISDRDLGPAAKLVLLVLAERAYNFNIPVRMSYGELEAITGLGAERLGRGIKALRDGGYIAVTPGRRSSYRLLTIRAVGKEGE